MVFGVKFLVSILFERTQERCFAEGKKFQKRNNNNNENSYVEFKNSLCCILKTGDTRLAFEENEE